MIMVGGRSRRTLPATRQFSRRYPPLLVVVVALILAVFALPSALNLPLANPAQTLEYAPVPGNPGNAPPGGNIAGLGLGTGGQGNGSSGDNTPGQAQALPPPPLLNGAGARPSDKQCVGNPPRQTEDPLSPPCVAFFSGNNGGSTYKGVSATEIRAVAYVSCYGGGEDQQDINATVPCGTYLDLDRPLPSGSTVTPRMLQALQRFFNARYQTYGRHVHLFVYFGKYDASQQNPQNQASDAMRRADAADNAQHIGPLADLTFDVSWQAHTAAYEQTMAGYGVLGFDSDMERPASLFSANPDRIWGYNPTLEEQADRFVSYVCRKIVPFPVSFSGNVADTGKTRKLGLLYAGQSASSYPEFARYGQLVQDGLKSRCGGVAVVHTFFTGESAESTNGAPNGYPASAASDMADFQRQGVTTIIWAQGLEHEHSDAGAKIGYLPEYVYAGDGVLDDFVPFRYQNQAASSHAILVSTVPRFGTNSQDVCGQALLEVDPSANANDLAWACHYYPYLRQFFTAVQVAGPNLSPDTINQGFRAIPQRTSSDPQTPACYYPAGVYTCVHDATAAWWDNTGRAPNSNGAGCWRLMQGGARYQTEGWSPGDAWGNHTGNDPCNGYSLGHYTNPSP